MDIVEQGIFRIFLTALIAWMMQAAYRAVARAVAKPGRDLLSGRIVDPSAQPSPREPTESSDLGEFLRAWVIARSCGAAADEPDSAPATIDAREAGWRLSADRYSRRAPCSDSRALRTDR